ncbi:MAG: Bug family tripartite tricarboxylate transporter substrate binding protein [Burkholderiales bacterium]
MRIPKRLAELGAVAVAVVSFGAQAQAWPTKPLRMIVTFPPGGITDFSARVISPKLAEAMGQPVIVENRVGAGGNIGTDLVAKAPPDGYMLMVAAPPNAINVALYKTLPFDTRKDLAPVALIGSVPNVLVVNADSPIKSVQTLVESARANPGKFNFASNGTGTTIQLSGELFKYQGKFAAVHIPFRGAPAAMTALLSGEVDFMFDSLSVSIQQIRAGKLRLLALTSRVRNPLFPDTPTMIESGFKDFEVSGWTGMLTTGGTPAPVVARLESEVRRALALPDIVSTFAKPGMNVHFAPAREFASFLDAEIERWGVAVKVSGAQAD